MEIKIKTPQWVDLIVATAKYWKNSIKWIIKPPRCSSCSARLHSNSQQFEHNVFGNTRLKLANFSTNKLCNKCILDEVNLSPEVLRFSIGSEKPKEGKCDCCNDDTKIYKFFETAKIRLHFCLGWWNGFWICKNCIRDVLKNGKSSSDIFRIDGNKMLPVGAYNLHLNDTGKVQLFKIVKY